MNLVLLGDSLIAYHRWNRLGVHRNAGIPGDTTDGLRYRLNYTLEKKPDTIILLIGINDLLQGRETPEILEDYRSLLTSMQAVPNIYVLSCLPVSRLEQSFELNTRIDLFNRELARMASQFDRRFLDVARLLKSEDGSLASEFTTDGVHLTDEAYEQIETYLLTHLHETGNSRH